MPVDGKNIDVGNVDRPFSNEVQTLIHLGIFDMGGEKKKSHYCLVCGKTTQWKVEQKHSGDRERRSCLSCGVTLTVTQTKDK